MPQAATGRPGRLACRPEARPRRADRAKAGTWPAPLRSDLSRYLATRRQAEHISAVALRVAFRGTEPAINVAAGTTRYAGGGPVSPDALWQIGSNTKAFTAVMLLQLEAEGRLSINDTVGKWLPQYPAWRTITIKQLLDMTSGIPDYADQPAFASGEAAGTGFSAARLVGYVAGEVFGDVWNYSNTNYILAQMIIEKVTHDTYADQLTRRIIIPLGLHNLCYAPYTCPAADAARMPAGYFFNTTVANQEPPNPRAPLLGKPVPPLALTWAQGAGGIISSLQDMTTWDRALYQGQELPPPQQRSLFFWSEEHVTGHQPGGRVAYPALAQASALTGPAQSAIFGFPRVPGA